VRGGVGNDVMMHMPNTSKTFLDLLNASIRHHFPVLKKIIWWILLFVMVKDLHLYIGGSPDNLIWVYVVGIVVTALLIYLFAMMLYTSNRVLRSEPVALPDAFFAVSKQLVPLYLASLLFIIAPILLVFAAKFILHLLASPSVLHYKFTGLIFSLVVGLPILYAYLRYFYTIPLIAMEGLPIGEAFYEASALVGRNIVRIFGVYACIFAIWALVSPNTLHGHFMQAYHVSALFDFIVFCVTLPIIVNLIVFMRNDLRLREAED